jgi:hypothetical protein
VTPQRAAYLLVLLVVFGVAAVGSYSLGMRRPPAGPKGPPQIGVKYDSSTAFPAVEAPQTETVTPRDSRSQALRAATIRRDIDAIRAECTRAGDGDWDTWERATETYRMALKARLATLKTFDPPPSLFTAAKYEAFEGFNDFPLFEMGAREHLVYLYDPDTLKQFRSEKSILAARRWLGQRGIDLIFVPVPKMAEVYIEHFLQPCPPDGVLAPQLRRALLEMLEADAEVVDTFALLRPVRDPAPDYLFNTCDTHWAPRGMRVAAKDVADRISRYAFAARARYGLPLFRVTPGPYSIDGYLGGLDSMAAWPALSPKQQALARRAQTTSQPTLHLYDGRQVEDDPKSPVIVIGNSYAEHFVGALMRELNMRVHEAWGRGDTTEAFYDFVRDPQVLDNARVIVWVTSEHQMTRSHIMPPPIAAEVARR